MYDFNYTAPSSLKDVQAALASSDESKMLAGGMSLLSAMKLRLNRPAQLVDLRNVQDLRGVTQDGGELVVGAMTRHADVAFNEIVKAKLPALAVLAGGIGDRQVRNRGTIGGSLANSDPAACYPAGLIGLGGSVVTDRRRIDADEFFTGLFETALEPGEIITHVRLRIPRRAAYVKWKQSASRFALVGVMVAEQHVGTFRVGVTGAKAHAYRESTIEQVLNGGGSADDVRKVKLDADEYNSDMHADEEYRRHLVVEIAARAVEELRRS